MFFIAMKGLYGRNDIAIGGESSIESG